FVALDSYTGDIRAVVGGYAIREGNMTFRVRRMQRQPGSVIKGVLYATAFDERVLRINDLVIDERVNIGGYRPRNWNHKYLGPVPLRRALAMSINTVAVKTLDDVGVSTFRDRLLSALDLSYGESRDRFPANLSLALGSGEVSPLELARIYAMIENGGRVVYPRLVTRIENQEGDIIWQDYGRPDDGEIVLSEEACSQAVRLMESVFDPEVEGTVGYVGKSRAKNPDYLPFAIAGKTGTVQSVAATYKKYPGMRGARDAWFVGLAPGEAAVVWLGHDEGAPFPGGGSSTAAPVWIEYARRALKGRVAVQWPERVREIEVIDPAPEPVPEPENAPDSETDPAVQPGSDGSTDLEPESETSPKPDSDPGPAPDPAPEIEAPVQDPEKTPAPRPENEAPPSDPAPQARAETGPAAQSVPDPANNSPENSSNNS
ncbi:MAG: penicillin-binding transpeptidase domain-containing protein, partial [Leptospirales bacterium]